MSICSLCSLEVCLIQAEHYMDGFKVMVLGLANLLHPLGVKKKISDSRKQICTKEKVYLLWAFMYYFMFKKVFMGGTWVAQLVDCPTSAQVMISRS